MSTITATAALPYTLPPPPGIDSISKHHSTASLTTSSLPSFHFHRRSLKLNWRDLLQLDLTRIIHELDLATLHAHVEAITYADIGPDDVAYFTDTNFLHLFRLCQLLLEYTLFSWTVTSRSLNERKDKYTALREYTERMKQTLMKYVGENKELKKELKLMKKVVQVMEEKERAVGSAGGYSNTTAKVARHPHPHNQFHPHPPSTTHHRSAHEEEKEAIYQSMAEQQQSQQQEEHHHNELTKQLHDRLVEESAQRNQKLEHLQTSLNLLLQAQQEEVRKTSPPQNLDTSKGATGEDHKQSNTYAYDLASPSQQAQQRLLASIMREVESLQQTPSSLSFGQQSSNLSETIGVGIIAFDRSKSMPESPITPMNVYQQQQHNEAQQQQQYHHPSRIYDFHIPENHRAQSYQLGSYTQLMNQKQQNTNMTNPNTMTGSFGGAGSQPITISTMQTPGASPSKGSLSTLHSPPLTQSRPSRTSLISSYTPSQKKEYTKLLQYLQDIESDELGAELVKRQWEEERVKREDDEMEYELRKEEEEQEVRKIEHSLTPGHPLLKDTILDGLKNTMDRTGGGGGGNIQPPPSAIKRRQTIELNGTASLRLKQDLMIGDSTVLRAQSSRPQTANSSPLGSPRMSRSSRPGTAMSLAATPQTQHQQQPHYSYPSPLPFLSSALSSPSVTLSSPFSSGFHKTLSTTRDPVLPPAPLAVENDPVLTLEERAELLTNLSPTSKLRAIELERDRIHLASVIKTRVASSGKLHYTPFPSLPFLNTSFYSYTTEQLRELYDETYLWMDTCLRTEENAEELLKYAVQMDVTGEIYQEVEERVNAYVGDWYDPQESEEYQEAAERLRKLEQKHKQTEKAENARLLSLANWHNNRINNFVSEYTSLQNSEQEKDYLRANEKLIKLEEKDHEFQEYLKYLEKREKTNEIEERKLVESREEEKKLFLGNRPTSAAVNTDTTKSLTGATKNTSSPDASPSQQPPTLQLQKQKSVIHELLTAPSPNPAVTSSSGPTPPRHTGPSASQRDRKLSVHLLSPQEETEMSQADRSQAQVAYHTSRVTPPLPNKLKKGNNANYASPPKAKSALSRLTGRGGSDDEFDDADYTDDHDRGNSVNTLDEDDNDSFLREHRVQMNDRKKLSHSPSLSTKNRALPPSNPNALQQQQQQQQMLKSNLKQTQQTHQQPQIQSSLKSSTPDPNAIHSFHSSPGPGLTTSDLDDDPHHQEGRESPERAFPPKPLTPKAKRPGVDGGSVPVIIPPATSATTAKSATPTLQKTTSISNTQDKPALLQARSLSSTSRPTTSSGRPKSSGGGGGVTNKAKFIGKKSFDDDDDDDDDEEEVTTRPRGGSAFETYSGNDAKVLGAGKKPAANNGSSRPGTSTAAAASTVPANTTLKSATATTNPRYSPDEDDEEGVVSDVSSIVTLEDEPLSFGGKPVTVVTNRPPPSSSTSTAAAAAVNKPATSNMSAATKPTSSPSVGVSSSVAISQSLTAAASNPANNTTPKASVASTSSPSSSPLVATASSPIASAATTTTTATKGRPRTRQGTLGGSASPSISSTNKPAPDEDSLSSLLNGSSMRRPTSRGGAAGGFGGSAATAGTFKSKFGAGRGFDSDQDSSLDLE